LLKNWQFVENKLLRIINNNIPQNRKSKNKSQTGELVIMTTKADLTSTEIANLWIAYIDNSAMVIKLKYVLKIMEDTKILQTAYYSHKFFQSTPLLSQPKLKIPYEQFRKRYVFNFYLQILGY
jgi:hypothetical protein